MTGAFADGRGTPSGSWRKALQRWPLVNHNTVNNKVINIAYTMIFYGIRHSRFYELLDWGGSFLTSEGQNTQRLTHTFSPHCIDN
jgi:hypothetical protein